MPGTSISTSTSVGPLTLGEDNNGNLNEVRVGSGAKASLSRTRSKSTTNVYSLGRGVTNAADNAISTIKEKINNAVGDFLGTKPKIE